MDFLGDGHIKKLMQEKVEKQKYLQENILNLGYDSNDFANYMSWQRGKFLTIIQLNSLNHSIILIFIILYR
mgnify:CR=1 FL=1